MHTFVIFFLNKWGKQLWGEVRDTPKLNVLEKWIVIMWNGFQLGQDVVQLFSCQPLTFKRRFKSRLPFAGIIRSSPYSPRFQDKG